MTLDLDQIERINNAGDRYGHITPGVVAELCAEVRRLRERREGPGSPAARFSYLLHELEALFPGVVNPVLSDPPETKLIDAVRQLRAELPGQPLLVVPGIRPAGAEAGDQRRIATPASAIAAGASMLVVGRPITQAADPATVAEAILAEIESAS